jgi:hypothetical protein
MSKHGPNNPRILVGDGHGSTIVAAALPKLVDPGTVGVLPVDRGADDGTASMHEQGSQLLVATLADAQQHTPVSAGVLTRD